MYLKLFGLALTGKLIIYLAQIFPFRKVPIIGKLWEPDKFFSDLFLCDLCLGVWVYSLLNLLFGVNLLQDIFYVRILSEAITGAIISFTMHLITLGWNAKFKEYNLG